MSELVRICSLEELPAEGHAKEVSVAGKAVCIARVHDEVAAMDNVCPHRGGPLAEGLIENGKVVCPWHAWEFDPKSGECLTVSGTKVDIYRIQVQGDDVFLEI
jgi:nitrite reductase (NADH) small subunit